MLIRNRFSNITKRRQIIKALQDLFSPRMYESSFRIGKIGESRPLQLYAVRDASGELTEWDIRGYVLDSFCGWAENGIMVDKFAGGCVIEDLGSIPTADLKKLLARAIKELR